MKLSDARKQKIQNELKYTATRSSGPGGQNVNKVNTQVELPFSLTETVAFSETEIQILQHKLNNRINSDNELILVSSVYRSQWRNKEEVIRKFFDLVENALTQKKKRIKTSPTKSSKLKRIEGKKLLSNKKQLRKPPEL
ncbi:alternative ribosome rescue aminoacyl-tRNA hydrolase ArfB [Prolixibacteraceae bacterium Z1-6]|uniref:Alternative ribosome rescue aminoacyl-tRNA hydrolase ArfB n=1 Tax=Draconibacterium aestuarii TaxID=2998507 RepID=A0A9X3J8K1_9BACT|nr:alternative ribosome rescue aminoacyl-tRNA hydrolase ArfB [Prolixibacteraceae bacterium Z1-6]